MEELLTLKEIAKSLGVPESNLRYYRNRIGDFLPSMGKGRRRRYFPEAVEIFQKTIDYINEGVTLDRVYSLFADNKPLTLKEDIARPAQEELANLIVEKIKENRHLFVPGAEGEDDTATLRESLQKANEEIQSLKETIARLESETSGDSAALHENEAAKNEIAELRRKNQEMQEILAEKERIMQGQKSALTKARDKRQSLSEELKRLKTQQ